MAFPWKWLRHQLILLGRVARSLAHSPLRSSTFIGDTLQPQVGQYVSRVGRPRQDWCSELLKQAATVLGNTALAQSLQDVSPHAQKGMLDSQVKQGHEHVKLRACQLVNRLCFVHGQGQLAHAHVPIHMYVVLWVAQVCFLHCSDLLQTNVLLENAFFGSV